MTWYFVPRILSAIISVAILVVLTRVMEPADFGRYNVTLLVGTLLFSFTFLWLIASISRFDHSKEFEGETIASVLSVSFVAAMFLLFCAGVAQLFLTWSWLDSLFFAVTYCVSHMMHELGTACLRQYNEGPKYAAVTLLRYILGVFLAVVLILSGGGYKSAVIGMSLGAALTGSYALGISLRRSGMVMPRISSIRTFFFFGFPLSVVGSSSTFFALASQLAISFWASMDSTGFFAAAQSLASRTIRLPMDTLMRAVAPSVFEAQEKNGRASSDAVLDRYFSFLLLISVPILLALVFSADVFANLLFEPDFADQTAEFLKVLALASFILGLQGAYFSFAFTRSKKTALQLGITFCMLLVHSILSFLIVYMIGAQGAPYAYLASGAMGLFFYYLFGRKVDQIRVPVVEFAKTLVGTIAFVPFGIMTNISVNVPTQFALLVLGMTAMFFLLVAIKQTAAMVVWEKARLLMFDRGFSV